MLFDLNVLIRETDGNWDDTNAMQIINFARGHNMQVDWQLGNGKLLSENFFFSFVTEL